MIGKAGSDVKLLLDCEKLLSKDRWAWWLNRSIV